MLNPISFFTETNSDGVSLSYVSGLENLQARLNSNVNKSEMVKVDYNTTRPNANAYNEFCIIGNVDRPSESRFILGCKDEAEARQILIILYKLAGEDASLIGQLGIMPKISYPSAYNAGEKNTAKKMHHGIEIPYAQKARIMKAIDDILEFRQEALTDFETNESDALVSRDLCFEAVQEAGLTVADLGFLMGISKTISTVRIT